MMSVQPSHLGLLARPLWLGKNPISFVLWAQLTYCMLIHWGWFMRKMTRVTYAWGCPSLFISPFSEGNRLHFQHSQMEEIRPLNPITFSSSLTWLWAQPSLLESPHSVCADWVLERGVEAVWVCRAATITVFSSHSLRDSILKLLRS